MLSILPHNFISCTHSIVTRKGNVCCIYPSLQHWNCSSRVSRCVRLFLFWCAGQLMLEHLFQGVELPVAGEAHVHWWTLHGFNGIGNQKNILVGKHKRDLEKGERGHQTLHASNMNLTTSDMPSGEAVPHLSQSKMLTMKDKRKSFFFCHLNVLKMLKIAEFTLTEAGSWRCLIYLMKFCDKFSHSNRPWIWKYRATLIGGSDVHYWRR